MSDYFDRLEVELRAAVPRAASTAWPARRRIRVGNGMTSAMLGVAVALAVAVLAVLLLGHTHQASEPAAPRPASPSAVPTLRQLLDNFVILRRQQTAADRSWRPPAGSSDGAHPLPRLTRLARTLANGDRVFVTVGQLGVAQGDEPQGSYAMNLWVIGPGGKSTSATFGPNAQYTIFPLQFPAPGGPGTKPPPGGLLWTSVVPDGVGAVRWTFVCNRLAHDCAAQNAIDLTVPVRNSIATGRQPRSGGCGAIPANCLAPSTVTWYGGGSHEVVARYTPTSVISTPPFVLKPAAPPANGVPPKAAPRRILDVLSGRGIGILRFGARPATARAAIYALLGQQGGLYRRAGDCRVDHQITWSNPSAVTGEPSLTAYFAHDRLAGYQYGDPGGQDLRHLPAHGPVLATIRGLTRGDTLERGRQLYGRAFQISTAQGGSWRVNTSSGRIDGYASGVPRPGNLNALKVVTIDAGNVGCPALSP